MDDPAGDQRPSGRSLREADHGLSGPLIDWPARLAARLAAADSPARRLRRARLRPGRHALRLVVGLALLVLAGTLLLWLPLAGADRPLRLDEAFFTAVSALSTTGLSVVTPGRDLSLFGQLVVLLLMQVGGIGFMFAAVVTFRLLGRRITLEERLALRDSLGLISTGALLRLARRVLEGVLLIEATGTLLLWLNWQRFFGPGRALYYALFHTISAFSNASFDLFSATPDAPARFPTDPFTLLTLSLLIVLGSIGIPVLADLARWPRRHSLSLHTRLTLVTAGVLLAGGALILLLAEGRPGGLWAEVSLPRQLQLAYFHSAASRTAGFVLQPLGDMSPASVLTLTGLMFIGGSPASMGGGITTSTAAILFLAMRSYIRGHSVVTVSRRSIPAETVLKAVSIFVLSLLMVVLVTLLLLLTQETTLSEGLFEVVSAFATSGYTLGLTPRLDLFGRVLIALTMFWGRLGALTIVIALARRDLPERVIYPEEQVLIG